MKTLEKTITAITIAVFVFLVLYSNREEPVEVYDCNQLYKHKYVPEPVLQECFKFHKPINSISI